MDVVQITRCYGKMQKEAQMLKCTLESLKQDNTELNNNLNLALEQRDLVRQEMGDLCKKVQPFNHFRENFNRRFEGEENKWTRCRLTYIKLIENSFDKSFDTNFHYLPRKMPATRPKRN